MFGGAVEVMTSESLVDSCLLSQYEEQLSDLKSKLSSVPSDILFLDKDEDSQSEHETWLGKILCEHQAPVPRSSMQSTPHTLLRRVELSCPTWRFLPSLGTSLLGGPFGVNSASISMYECSQLSDSENTFDIPSGTVRPSIWSWVCPIQVATIEKLLIASGNDMTDLVFSIKQVWVILYAPPLKGGSDKGFHRLTLPTSISVP